MLLLLLLLQQCVCCRRSALLLLEQVDLRLLRLERPVEPPDRCRRCAELAAQRPRVRVELALSLRCSGAQCRVRGSGCSGRGRRRCRWGGRCRSADGRLQLLALQCDRDLCPEALHLLAQGVSVHGSAQRSSRGGLCCCDGPCTQRRQRRR